MPPLDNPRHERFAQELAKGKTQEEIYGWATEEWDTEVWSTVAEGIAAQFPLCEVLSEVGLKPVQVSRKRDFYVYAVVDNETGQAFYVGKGKGKRAESHVSQRGSDRAAVRERVKALKIKSKGASVVVLADGLSEAAALGIERKIIVTAHHVLLNVALGDKTYRQYWRDVARDMMVQRHLPFCWYYRHYNENLKGWGWTAKEAIDVQSNLIKMLHQLSNIDIEESKSYNS